MMKQTVVFSDDFSFCNSYNGMNVCITGATGTIGSMVTDALLRNSMPNKVALFCRDDQNLPTQIQSFCRVPNSAPDKKVYSFEVDFKDQLKITRKIHEMLRFFDGRVDCVIFCHGLINFMGGVDGNLPEYDLLQKVNVTSTMQFVSVLMPFLRMTQGTATVLSSSAGE